MMLGKMVNFSVRKFTNSRQILIASLPPFTATITIERTLRLGIDRKKWSNSTQSPAIHFVTLLFKAKRIESLILIIEKMYLRTPNLSPHLTPNSIR